MKKIWNSRIIKFFRSSPKTTIGVILVLIVLIMTFGAGLFTDWNPNYRSANQYHVPPSQEHVLGTTQLGKDVFAQTLYGGRKSVSVGLFAGALTIVMALFFGISAGYIGGVYDGIVSMVINIIMVIPNTVLLLLIASLLDGGISPFLICVIIGLTNWPFNARNLRAQTMSLRNRDFVYSAEALGESKFRIIFIEIMPNMLSMIAASFVSTMIYAITAHATLEYIGFGDPLSVTWGIMLYNAQNTGALQSGLWWEIIGPILGLVMLGAGLTLINFSIDEISNPKLKAQRIMRQYYKAKKISMKKERRAA